MRLAWRLARREVRRRPGRTVLVVSLAAATVAGITVGDLAFRSRELPAPTDFGRAVVRERVNFSGSLTDGDAPWAALEAAVRKSVPRGVASALGYDVFAVPLQRGDNLGLGVDGHVVTVDLTAPLMSGATVVRSGRLATTADEVAVGSQVADRLQVAVGDRITLVMPERTFRVVGIADLASGDRSLFAAPGFPVQQLRFDPSALVVYLAASHLRSDGGIEPLPPATAVGLGDAQVSFYYEPRPVGQPATGVELLVGWLLAVLVLGVLGIVVAAAFAASGRRQLVTLGQLGATGADVTFARRFLALQGAATSGLGAVVGVGVGFVVTSALRNPLLRHGQWNVMVFDLIVIVATTMCSGTLAALVPTRALASAPVLTSLAGRVPVKQVRPQQVRLGVVAVVLGLLVLGLSVESARAAGVGTSLATALAVVSAGAVLGGVCAVCPAIVDRWTPLGRGSSGSTRLAVRSMVRHRARSAALVAAIAAVGAAGVAGASGIERWSQLNQRLDYRPMLNVVTVMPFSLYSGGGQGDGGSIGPTKFDPAVQRSIDAVVPGIHWESVRGVVNQDPSVGGMRLVADDAALAALAVPPDRWDLVRHLPASTVVARSAAYADPSSAVFVPTLKTLSAQFISPADAASSRWLDAGSMLVGTAPIALTADQRSRLNVATFPSRYSSVFANVPGDRVGPLVNYEYPVKPPAVTRTEARWFLIGSLLLLVTLIVSMGLALWAAEGKVERDQLVALGARPRSLAVMAQVRAWVIATTGGLIAVPLGWGMLQVVLHAADKHSPFPWLTAVMVAVGLPVIVSLGAFLASAAGQRLRPVVGSTMSVD